jgi:hypothetical protein
VGVFVGIFVRMLVRMLVLSLTELNVCALAVQFVVCDRA